MNKLILAVAVVLAAVLAVSSQEHACSFNEVWNNCGTACPIHCPVRNVKTGQLEDGSHRLCIMMCKVGCQCAHGYVRDLQRSGACVEKALCSPPA